MVYNKKYPCWRSCPPPPPGSSPLCPASETCRSSGKAPIAMHFCPSDRCAKLAFFGFPFGNFIFSFPHFTKVQILKWSCQDEFAVLTTGTVSRDRMNSRTLSSFSRAKKRSLLCCTISNSRPPNTFSPTGSRRFRQAITMLLACLSRRICIGSPKLSVPSSRIDFGHGRNQFAR